MPESANKPVIFLAFANDRDDSVGYLRNLPDEARRLRDLLNSAEQAGLCEVEVRSNSTAADIFKVFQNPKFRNRIAVFHYGGHANGYELLLESAEGQTAAADAGGLAAFLSQQQGLQLVFLNGCSTQQQTQGLLDANVPAVISTSRAIDDRVATDFSCQFYQGLAGGATIRTAYNEAAAAARTAKGGDTRALYFGSAKDPQNALEADRWPWNLYLREGSEHVDQWNLPEAVNDPLFGLPPLPEQDLPETPYRHLNWFTRQHAAVFFGRGHQIRELYDRLTARRSAPIILFFGQSGVGKSSVLDAGLIPRLEQRYEVRYLRRTAGGLLDTLQLAFLPDASDEPLESAWRVKEQQTGKPLIVFLDQVEEHLTRPIANMPDEMDQLLNVVQATFRDPNRRPQGKLVLGFRKEWLAELESHLVSYELPRTKVFLERLDRRGIIEVVLGPARSERLREQYGLTVEDGLAEIIADDLLADRGSAVSTTLQILLSKMWTKATEVNYEHPRFSLGLYHSLQRDGILLRDFLKQQITALGERYPEAVDSGLLLDIIALHTTPLGTANQWTVEELQEQYAHLGATLGDLLELCQDLHLLTVVAGTQERSSNTTRLAHDTLAPLVRERYDASDKPGMRARRVLDARRPDWQDGKVGTPLDDADLHTVEDGIFGTRSWTDDESRLIQASRRARARRQQTRTSLRVVGLVAIVFVAGSAVIAFMQWRSATSANTQLKNTIGERDEANESLKEALALEEEATQRAVQRTRIANVRRLAAQAEAVRAEQPQLSILLAAEAVRRSRGDARSASAAAINALRTSFINCGDRCLVGHRGKLTDLAITGDGERLITSGEDGTIRLWSLNDAAAEVVAIDAHEGPIHHVELIADSDRLITAGEDGAIKLWNLNDKRPTDVVLEQLEAGSHLDVVAAANGQFAVITKRDTLLGFDLRDKSRAFTLRVGSAEEQLGIRKTAVSPNGRFVAAAVEYPEYEVWLWDVTIEPKTARVLDCYPLSLCFSPDSRYLITGGGSIEVFDLQDLNVKFPSRKGHVNFVETIGLTNDLNSIVSAGGTHAYTEPDFVTRVWDFDDSQADPIELHGHSDTINHHVVTPDGQYLITASDDGTAHVWQFDQLDGTPTVLQGHEGPISCLAVTPNGKRLVTGSDDGTARIWSINNPASEPHTVAVPGDYVSLLNISPDGKTFVAGSDGQIYVWTLSSPTEPPLMLVKKSGGVGLSCFSPDSRLLAVSAGSIDEQPFKDGVLVWDLSRPSHAPTAVGDKDLYGDSIRGLAFSPDGEYLVIAGDQTHLWQVSDLSSRSSVLTGGDYMGPAVFSADGKVMAVAANLEGNIASSEGPRVRTYVWRMDNLDLRPMVFEKSGSFINDVIVSPNASRLIVGGDFGIGAYVWSLKQPSDEPRILRPKGSVQTLSLTKDGRYLVAGCGAGIIDGDKRDCLVYVWDLDDAEAEPALFRGHQGAVSAVAMTPDRRVIAAGATDGVVRLWSFSEPTEEPALLRDPRPIEFLKITPDGKYLVTANEGENGIVRVWHIQPDELMQIAEHKVARNFTPAEWATYFADEPYITTFARRPVPAERETESHSEDEIRTDVVVTLLNQYSNDKSRLASELIALIGNDDQPTRLRAFKELVGLGPSVVPLAIAELSSENMRVRFNALGILAELCPESGVAIPLVMKLAASDPSAEVRGNAARTLYKIAASDSQLRREVEEQLATSLSDSEPATRFHIVDAIEHLYLSPSQESHFPQPESEKTVRLRQLVSNELEGSSPRYRRHVVAAMLRMEAHAVLRESSVSIDEVIALLKEGDRETRLAVAKHCAFILPTVRQSSIPTFLRLLRDPDRQVRLTLALGLTKLDPKAIDIAEHLAGYLDTSPTDVKLELARLLLEIAVYRERASAALLEIIEREDGNWMYEHVPAVEALAALGPDARSTLPRQTRVMLTTEWGHLQYAIVQAIQVIAPNDPRANESLEKLWRNDAIDHEVRVRALHVWSAAGNFAEDSASILEESLRPDGMDYPFGGGGYFSQYQKKVLSLADANYAAEVLVLGCPKSKRYAALLDKALMGDDVDSRLAVLTAMLEKEYELERAFDRLSAALEDNDVSTQLKAARCISAAVSQQTKWGRLLLKVLNREGEDESVRQSAAGSLASLAKELRPLSVEITSLLSDEDWMVRRIAIVAIGDMGLAIKDGKHPLLDALKDSNPSNQVFAARKVVTHLGATFEPIVAEHLITMLEFRAEQESTELAEDQVYIEAARLIQELDTVPGERFERVLRRLPPSMRSKINSSQ